MVKISLDSFVTGAAASTVWIFLSRSLLFSHCSWFQSCPFTLEEEEPLSKGGSRSSPLKRFLVVRYRCCWDKDRGIFTIKFYREENKLSDGTRPERARNPYLSNNIRDDTMCCFCPLLFFWFNHALLFLLWSLIEKKVLNTCAFTLIRASHFLCWVAPIMSVSLFTANIKSGWLSLKPLCITGC